MPLGRLDHFEILRFLGRGGWGDVFLARDTHLDCDVALKVLHPEFADNHEYRDRLRGEAHTLAQLDHPNIVGVLAYNEAAPDPPGCLWPGQPGPHPARVHYLAMRFVEGHDLAAEITGRLLPLERVLDYAKQIGRGLHAAHSHNIIHRDLKPANIRVTPDGVLKLLDFGLARSPRAIQDSLRSTQSMSREYIVGTLGYMCPEQARTGMRPDARCDLFSYGVILYELLTGRRPFAGDGLLELFSEMAQHEPPPMSRYRADVPPALDQVVRRLLQTDPQKRHLTAAEVVEALEQVVLKPPGLLARLRAWLAPHGGRMLRVATAAAVVVAAALWGPGAIERSREWFIPRPEVVAVPDLQNLTDDPAMDRLLAGLSTDLVTSLVRAGGVNVVRPTLRDSAGRPERDPRKLRRTYGASAVLSGSLRTGGGPLGGPAFALHIESVSTRDQRVLWVEELHAPPGQIGRLRAALVQGALAHFSGDAGPAADLDTQRPIAADEAYLRGLGWLTDVNDPVARDSALAEFDRALALAPDYGRALAGRARTLGWIYAREQDPVLMEQAERDARRAIASAPAEYEGRLALARILLDRGRTPDAILELQAVLAGNPRLADAHTQIANAQRKVGRLDDADTHYQAAIALAPDDPRHHRAYGAFLLQSRADSPGAKAEFRRVIELTPDENRGHELLAAAYMTECRFAEALETFRRRPHPDQWTHDARANHATANFFAGRYPEALRDYLDVASAFPNDGVTRMSLGDCYARMGRRADALDAYRLSLRLLERALVVNPDDPNLRAWHSMSLAKAGDVSGAKAELAEHFPTLAVTDAEVLHTVAKALALCGERSRAIAAVDTLVRGRGVSPCLLAVEDELESLRSDQRFRKLVRRPPP